jgi:hypothetical protein
MLFDQYVHCQKIKVVMVLKEMILKYFSEMSTNQNLPQCCQLQKKIIYLLPLDTPFSFAENGQLLQ